MPAPFLLIPAYNAAQTLPQLFARFPGELWDQSPRVVVLDDGSTDNTTTVANALARDHAGVEVHCFAVNGGYGRMVAEGLRLAKQSGAEYAVCLHADGQYPPEKISGFLRYMQAEEIDILQGSRHHDGTARAGGMPLYKLVAGKILTRLENTTFGLSLSDYHSGFLLYSRRALEALPISHLSHSFDFDLEIIACARALGLRIGELGIPTRYAGEASYLNPLTYGLRVLRVMAKYRRGHYHRLGGKEP